MTQRKKQKELKFTADWGKSWDRTQSLAPWHGPWEDVDSQHGTCVSGMREMLQCKEELLGRGWTNCQQLGGTCLHPLP